MKVSRSHPRRRLALLSAVVFVVGACSILAPASEAPEGSGIGEPAGPPVLGIDWGRATSVERPANYEATVAPSYVSVHPILRIAGQATMADVMALPGGGYVSIGYSPPAWTPLAWTSADGLTWRIHEIGTTEFTFPEALASGPDGTVVAVGRSGRSPLAWTSRDGVTWEAHDVATLGSGGVAQRMTAVAAGGGGGYVAGGSVGPELAERHARFWASEDGSAWQPVPDDAAAFAGAEVRDITSFADGFVAVGVLGDAQQQTGAVAWTSADGLAWTRVDSPAFDGGKAVAVVESPAGGLVAVGTTVERREAVAWTSPDGRAWSRAATEDTRLFPSYSEDGGYIQMTDVAVVDGKLVGVGIFQGLQRGTATSWVSSDGIHWDRANSAPVQQQIELYAVTAGGPGAIVVGAFGAPDAYAPTVLVSPAR